MLERERETVMCAIEKKRKKQRNMLKRERRYANVTGCEPQPCIYLPDVSDDCYLRSLQETILFFNIYLMHNKLNSKNHFKKLKNVGRIKERYWEPFPLVSTVRPPGWSRSARSRTLDRRDWSCHGCAPSPWICCSWVHVSANAHHSIMMRSKNR